MLTKEYIEEWRVRLTKRYIQGDKLLVEANALCDLAQQALSQPKDAKCPECNDAYSEVCPVCQLDGHPVVEKLRAELNALKQPTAQAERLERLEGHIESAIRQLESNHKQGHATQEWCNECSAMHTLKAALSPSTTKGEG